MLVLESSLWSSLRPSRLYLSTTIPSPPPTSCLWFLRLGDCEEQGHQRLRRTSHHDSAKLGPAHPHLSQSPPPQEGVRLPPASIPLYSAEFMRCHPCSLPCASQCWRLHCRLFSNCPPICGALRWESRTTMLGPRRYHRAGAAKSAGVCAMHRKQRPG